MYLSFGGLNGDSHNCSRQWTSIKMKLKAYVANFHRCGHLKFAVKDHLAPVSFIRILMNCAIWWVNRDDASVLLDFESIIVVKCVYCLMLRLSALTNTPFFASSVSIVLMNALKVLSAGQPLWQLWLYTGLEERFWQHPSSLYVNLFCSYGVFLTKTYVGYTRKYVK